MGNFPLSIVPAGPITSHGRDQLFHFDIPMSSSLDDPLHYADWSQEVRMAQTERRTTVFTGSTFV